jgi:hypothetical protein
VNQAAGDMGDKSEQPQNEKDNDDGIEHGQSYSTCSRAVS